MVTHKTICVCFCYKDVCVILSFRLPVWTVGSSVNRPVFYKVKVHTSYDCGFCVHCIGSTSSNFSFEACITSKLSFLLLTCTYIYLIHAYICMCIHVTVYACMYNLQLAQLNPHIGVLNTLLHCPHSEYTCRHAEQYDWDHPPLGGHVHPLHCPPGHHRPIH